MATMIPSSLKTMPDTTAGERKLFDLFKKVLPDTCQVRYEVLLGERERRPDYLLVDMERGILIVEVKDWGVDKIREATPEQFKIAGMRGNQAPTLKMNPGRKCAIYMREAREQLVAMPDLRDEADRLNVRVDYFVAFPNISKNEFESIRLGELIDPARVLLQEDLVESGASFLAHYDRVLPKLAQPLRDQQRLAISSALVRDTTIPQTYTKDGLIPATAAVVRTDAEIIPTYQLSLEQEQIAKSLGEGPRLLRGLAGAGKTLIMLYRAKMLAANDPNIRILILCWNVSLGNYMRQIYEDLRIAAEGEVTIQHFSEFVRQVIKDKKRPDLDDPGFAELLDSVSVKDADKYDAIYIDEAQDFRAEWISFLFHHFLKGEPKQRNLLIAADDAQRIYQSRGFSWSSLDIQMVGRSKILKTVYRNSARVWIFAGMLLGKEAGGHDSDPGRVQFSSKGGKDPELIECGSLRDQVDMAAKIIQSLMNHGYAARNVLVLYKQKTVDGFQLVTRLRRQLTAAGVPHDWIAEDREVRRTFNWEADTVKISTVHSGKGMDSPVVLILGAETFQPKTDGRPIDETKLMYVAMTRAREYLIVLYSGNEGMVSKLLQCREEYLKYRDEIILEEQTREL